MGEQIDDVGVGEVSGQLVQAGGVTCAGSAGLRVGLKELVAGHGHKEELGVGGNCFSDSRA